jgi:molecular chaperone GrpE
MVKKKASDHGVISHKKHDETIDNKEDSNVQETSGQGNEESIGTDGLKTAEAEAPSSESAPSDKVIPEEKSSEEKLAEMQDKYLRLSAEFDNYRKRTLREKMELSKFAREELLLKILPVMDDFERALTHLDTASDCTAMREGINLIYQKFTDFLMQSGIKEVDSLNCPFNVDLHDAVAKVSVVEEEKKGKIVDVILKGYYLFDKVIRHSKVVVGE